MATLESRLRLSLIDQVSGRLKAIGAQLGAFQSRTRAMSTPIAGMYGRVAALAGGYIGLTSGYRGTIKAAMDFEDQMAEVRKVLDPTPAQFKQLSAGILGMSKRMSGIKAAGLAEIMAEAGQAGIAAQDLSRFTEFTAKAAVAFDTTARDTGNYFAKLRNIFEFTQPQLETWANTVNYLSNNMAAKAGEIIEFTNRAAGSAKPLGLAAEEVSAFGTAMIALGSVPETAGRAMNHFGRMITQASAGDKKVAGIFKSIGLNFREWNKLKKENGPAAMMKLFQTLKTSQNGAKAMLDLFGSDFSKDFSKLVDRPELLAQAFGLAGDKAQVAGSVVAEYINKTDTAQMKLSKFGNNLSALGISIGSHFLEPIGNAAAYLTDVLQTLDERVTIFDRFDKSVRGFLNGLGLDGGQFSKFVEDVKLLLFGTADGARAADELGRIFGQFQEYGRAVQELSDAIFDNPIGSFIAEISGYGFQLFIASVGFGLLAGAIRRLASAMMLITGAKAAVAILTTIAGIGGALFGEAKKAGGKLPRQSVTGRKPTGPRSSPMPDWINRGRQTSAPTFWETTKSAFAPWRRPKLLSGALKGIAGLFGSILGEGGINDLFRLTGKNPDTISMSGNAKALWDNLIGGKDVRDRYQPRKEDNAASLVGMYRWLMEKLPADLSRPIGDVTGKPATVQIEGIPEVITRPSGMQDVRVTNQPRPLVPVNVTVYATTNASGEDIARLVGGEVKSAVEGYHTD